MPTAPSTTGSAGAPAPVATPGLLAVTSDLGTLVVKGRDRSTWLNGLVTCDLAPLRAGDGAYGLFTSKVGKILADALVIVAEDRLVVGLPRDRVAAVAASLESYLVMEDADVSDASASTTWVQVHGPGSADAARAAAKASGGVGAAIDLTGLGGGAVAAPSATLAAATSALVEAGALLGDDAGWNVLRLERAVPRFGVDFDATSSPQEASLERRAVSFKKGCYLGQEVVCRLEMRGHVHKKLTALVLASGEPPAAGTQVETSEGEPVGAITSAATSARLGAPVALAMLKFAAVEPGRVLRVGGVEARVVVTPLA